MVGWIGLTFAVAALGKTTTAPVTSPEGIAQRLEHAIQDKLQRTTTPPPKIGIMQWFKKQPDGTRYGPGNMTYADGTLVIPLHATTTTTAAPRGIFGWFAAKKSHDEIEADYQSTTLIKLSDTKKTHGVEAKQDVNYKSHEKVEMKASKGIVIDEPTTTGLVLEHPKTKISKHSTSATTTGIVLLPPEENVKEVHVVGKQGSMGSGEVIVDGNKKVHKGSAKDSAGKGAVVVDSRDIDLNDSEYVKQEAILKGRQRSKGQAAVSIRDKHRSVNGSTDTNPDIIVKADGGKAEKSEVKSRGVPVIIASDGDKEIKSKNKHLSTTTTTMAFDSSKTTTSIVLDSDGKAFKDDEDEADYHYNPKAKSIGGIDTSRCPMTLTHIALSAGELSPEFSPTHYKYTVDLPDPHQRIAIIPEMDLSNPLCKDEAPMVTYRWPGNKKGVTEASPAAMKREIDLPANGNNLPVTMSISNGVTKDKSKYTVTFRQKCAPKADLKVCSGSDGEGHALSMEPTTSFSDAVRKVYVNPKADHVSLQLTCSDGATMYVDGKKTTQGTVPIKRNKQTHTQVIEVVCERKNSCDNVADNQHYALLLVSDWTEIPPPKVVIDELGAQCQFNEKKKYIDCPDPKTADRQITLISENEPSIKYTVKSKGVDVRLLNGQTTTKLPFGRGMRIEAEAGRQKASWPIHFGGSLAVPILHGLGWLLAGLLALLVLCYAAVIGLANVCGLGVPVGSTEIIPTMTMLTQYLCFSNFLRGTHEVESLTTPLKWITMFIPIPGTSGAERRHLSASHFSSAYGISLWGNSKLGDVTDPRNASGALFWCLVVLVAVILIHFCVYLNFAVIERRYTFPHRFRFGNWESRTVHLLAFPAMTASAYILATSHEICLLGRIAAIGTAVLLVGWASAVFLAIHSAIANDEVCWIWSDSVREAARKNDDCGYWTDTTPDQLQTQPVNRALCANLFPFRWYSTVADILPIALSSSLYSDHNAAVFAPEKMGKGHRTPSYPLAKAPQVVEVVRTRSPASCCKGARLVAGLLRTKWLDLLLTYEGLTRIHSAVVETKQADFTMPLIVKTSQLTGPISSGANAFFFDGARVPFIRIADLFFRIIMGACMGVALVTEKSTIKAAMFGIVAFLAFAFSFYTMGVKPYSRKFENLMESVVMFVIGSSAVAFLIYAWRHQEIGADLFLWILAAACLCLALYALVVIVSVVSAICCPPLEETRFLEKLSNCSAIISDEYEGWEVDLPAYSKYSSKELAKQSTSGRVVVHRMGTVEDVELHFTVRELQRASRTGALPIP